MNLGSFPGVGGQGPVITLAGCSSAGGSSDSSLAKLESLKPDQVVLFFFTSVSTFV